MTLQQLKYVIAIAESGSFSRAATKLYVSQPSLTGAVRDLEREIGITVFHRTGRGVTLTGEGTDFLAYARSVYQPYRELLEHYGKSASHKKKFSVTTQHFSFAVKAFVETVRHADSEEYEFAVRETRTRTVIDDVAKLHSEIGILWLSDFNRQILSKLLRSANLEFFPLLRCDPCVYLWRGHPLANESSVSFDMLSDYTCISYDQGEDNSFYFAEEILPTNEYSRTIKVTDRATVLNLMVGLNGYTLCPGIICEELNGSEYVAVPFRSDDENPSGCMEIGYIQRKNTILSGMAALYIEEIGKYLSRYDRYGKEI